MPSIVRRRRPDQHARARGSTRTRLCRGEDCCQRADGLGGVRADRRSPAVASGSSGRRRSDRRSRLRSLPGFARWLAERALLGAGTALVYPTLIAVIGDAARTPDPATSVGIYRRWRDAGYAVGAIVAGVIADVAGLAAAIVGRVDGDIGSACRGPDQGKHAAPARQQNS